MYSLSGLISPSRSRFDSGLRGLAGIILTVLVVGGLAGPVQAQSPLILESPNQEENLGGSSFGYSVAKVGGLGEDGPLIVGAPLGDVGGFSDGRVYLIDGANGQVLHTLTESSEEEFGTSVAGTDVIDGTAYAIVAAVDDVYDEDGAIKYREITLIQLIDPSDGSVVHTIASPEAKTGGTFRVDVASAGDVNGDGTPDILVGSPADTIDGAAGAGRAYVFSGADGSTLRTLESPNPEEGGKFGASVAGGTDFTGDGTPDLIVGAPREDKNDDGEEEGRAYLVDGASGTVLHTLTSDYQDGFGSGTFGADVAPLRDVNDDGTPDVIVGASSEQVYQDGTIYGLAGRVHLMSGADGTLLRTLTAENPASGYLGRAVAAIGDVNFDGVPDVAAGAPGIYPPAASKSEGPVRIFSGADGRVLDTLSAEGSGDIDFGLAVAGAGDADGDGVPDVLAAAVGEEASNGGTGRAYLFSGADLFLAATDSVSISSNGIATFDGTGISINFSGVSNSGTVGVKRFSIGPDGTAGISERNVSQYRVVIGAEGNLSFDSDTEVRFDVGSFPGISDPADVTLYTRSTMGGGDFSSLSTTVDENGTPDDPSDDKIVGTTGSFSEFVLASNSNPLPVELSTVEARTKDGSVQLFWETTSETNNAGFRIQHRGGGNDAQSGTWTQIGRVDGAGTTDRPQSYRFTADELAPGPHQFRLVQVNLDGTTRAHESVAVEVPMRRALHLSAPAPNPVAETATFSFAVREQSRAAVALYDVLGQKVKTLYEGTPPAGTNRTLRLGVEDLASGVYVLRLRADGRSETRRLTVVR